MNFTANCEYETQACECCENGLARLVTERVPFLYGAGNDTVTLYAEMPLWICKDCNERYTAEGAEEAEYDAICDHLERLRPAEIVALRQRAGLTQAELALQLGVGRASIARWETRAQLQSKVYDVLLREWRDRWNLKAELKLSAPRFRTNVEHREIAASAFRLRAAA